jgi:hypothetical protein
VNDTKNGKEGGNTTPDGCFLPLTINDIDL